MSDIVLWRCVVCRWWLDGMQNDPAPKPVQQECGGMASIDYRCAANWLSVDPEDRGGYYEYLLERS